MIGTVVLVSTSLDRFFFWDEAAFWSQVNDHRGSGASPSALEASREMGSVFLLRLLALFNDDLATTRLLWAALTVATMLAVFRQLDRFLGPWAGPIGAFVFGTFWVSELLVDSFYANQLGALFQLGAVTTYLSMRQDAGDRFGRGVGLGVLFAAAFWMRQVESSLVLTVLLADSLVRKPALVWRGRIKAVGAAGLTFVVTFAIPWLIDTVNRFGSVPSRIRDARSQEFGRGLVGNAGTYAETLLGRSIHLRSEAPLWAGITTVVVIALVAGMVATILLASRHDGGQIETTSRRATLALLLTLAAVSYGFFAFWIEIARDRYLMSGTVFAAAAAGGAIGLAIEHLPRFETRSRKCIGAVFFTLTALWLVSQTVISRHHEHVWDVSAWDQERTASLIRTLAADEPCTGVARFGQPVLQLGSGCHFVAAPDAAAARGEIGRMDRSDLLFVIWPTRQVADLHLDETWDHLVQRTTNSSLTISYHAPDEG